MDEQSLRRSAVLSLIAVTPVLTAIAQEHVTKEEFPVPTKDYSPYVDQNFPNRVLWGDTPPVWYTPGM